MELREVGNRLRILRKGRTQKEFSSAYGIPQGTLSKFEGGKLEPGLGFLTEVSKREGVSIHWILTGESDDTRRKWVIHEPAGEYQPLPSSTRKLLNSVIEILESGNEIIVDALKANIRAYLETIRAAGKNDKGSEAVKKFQRPERM